MIDADALLKKDLVTLDEALQIANKAVLMALNAVSILSFVSNQQTPYFCMLVALLIVLFYHCQEYYLYKRH